MDNKVIDIVPDEVLVEEPQKTVWRFVGNHLSINASHLAYVLNIIGVNVPSEIYERMPDEIKKHFMLVKV